jgi:hypothetical protein
VAIDRGTWDVSRRDGLHAPDDVVRDGAWVVLPVRPAEIRERTPQPGPARPGEITWFKTLETSQDPAPVRVGQVDQMSHEVGPRSASFPASSRSRVTVSATAAIRCSSVTSSGGCCGQSCRRRRYGGGERAKRTGIIAKRSGHVTSGGGAGAAEQGTGRAGRGRDDPGGFRRRDPSWGRCFSWRIDPSRRHKHRNRCRIERAEPDHGGA